jgi:hypothetical protein
MGLVSATAADITGTRLTNHGWQNWYRSVSKRRHRVILAARSGRTAIKLANSDTSDSYLDSLALSVTNPVAQDAVIWLGINDIVSEASGSSIAAAIRTIAAAAAASGKVPAVIVEIPRTNLSSAQQLQLMELQKYLYKYASLGEFGIIDPNPRYTDWTNTSNYSALGTLNYDTSSHPNAAGAKIVADCVNDYYAALYPAMPEFFQHHYTDDSSVHPTSSNRLANGMFASALTGWTTPSVSGAVTAVTASRIAAPDGYGYALACDVTVNAAAHFSIAQRNYDAGSGLVSGDSIQAACRYWVQGSGGSGDPTGVVSPYLRLDVNTTGGLGAGRVCDLWPENTTNELAQTLPFDGTMETVPYTFTGAEGNLSPSFSAGIRFSGAGSARIIIARPVVNKNMATYSSNEWTVV